jgi:hypothetical protein
MAIARHFKKIDIFMTMTANPNWPEIKQELLYGQTATMLAALSRSRRKRGLQK